MNNNMIEMIDPNDNSHSRETDNGRLVDQH